MASGILLKYLLINHNKGEGGGGGEEAFKYWTVYFTIEEHLLLNAKLQA